MKRNNETHWSTYARVMSSILLMAGVTVSVLWYLTKSEEKEEENRKTVEENETTEKKEKDDDRTNVLLFYYAQTGRVDEVKKLIQNGADVNCNVTKGNSTALHKAAYYGHVDVVKVLI